MKSLECLTFMDAFLSCNRVIYNGPTESKKSRTGDTVGTHALSYLVMDASSYDFFDSIEGRITREYAESFWQFMISGGTNASENFKKWAGTSQFYKKSEDSGLPDNFNTLYGPRIIKQIDALIEELNDNPDTRRGVVLILDANDQMLLNKDETVEYPCTIGTVYFLYKGKLCAHCLMRSQNMATVAQLDMYLQGKLLEHVARRLGRDIGSFYSTITDAHIYMKDIAYVRLILEKHGDNSLQNR